jgi:anaerobic magnesium-protoporphyrin IX monomethyl ester cyclase
MVVDCPAVGMGQLELALQAKSFQPRFAFWNTATPTLESDLDMARFIRGWGLQAITGVMGTHVTTAPDVAFANPFIDLVIRGEPEETIREICASENLTQHAVRGISWRDPKNGTVHHNPEREWISPRQIPAPAWQYLDLEPYRLPLKGRPFLIVAPVRGCPYKCGFCTAPLYYGKRLRKRPVQAVMDEISRGMEQLGVRDFFVWADTFTADPDYVKAFSLEILRHGLNIRWTCNSRVDTVNREMLEAMKRAGLWMISFGLESGNDGILKRSGKKITVGQSRLAVTMAHEMGIRTSGHFILGLPGETEKTMMETLHFALDLPLDIAQFYAAAPFPGTPLYKEAIHNGWLAKNTSFSQNAAIMNLPGLPSGRVNEFRRYAHRRFYGRPGAVLNMIGMMETGAYRSLLKGVGAFLKRF